MPGEVEGVLARAPGIGVEVSELLLLVPDPVVDGGEVPDGAEQLAGVASVFAVPLEVVDDGSEYVLAPELVLGSPFRDEALSAGEEGWERVEKGILSR